MCIIFRRQLDLNCIDRGCVLIDGFHYSKAVFVLNNKWVIMCTLPGIEGNSHVDKL